MLRFPDKPAPPTLGGWTRRRSGLLVPDVAAAANPGVTNEQLGIIYTTPAPHAGIALDIKWRTGVAPRDTIVPVHLGGWHNTPPNDRDEAANQGAYDQMFALGWNVCKPDYWGSESAAGYNHARPWNDVGNACEWIWTNRVAFNLSGRVHLLLISAGGEIGLMMLVRGLTGASRVYSATMWSGAVYIPQCWGTHAQGDAKAHVDGLDQPTHVANWNACVPSLVAVAPILIPGGGSQMWLRYVWSHDENTTTLNGINRNQPLQSIADFTALGHVNIVQREYSAANGDPVTNRHANFAGAAYGGEDSTSDIVAYHNHRVAKGFKTW